MVCVLPSRSAGRNSSAAPGTTGRCRLLCWGRTPSRYCSFICRLDDSRWRWHFPDTFRITSTEPGSCRILHRLRGSSGLVRTLYPFLSFVRIHLFPSAPSMDLPLAHALFQPCAARHRRISFAREARLPPPFRRRARIRNESQRVKSPSILWSGGLNRRKES
jgi:hypothetical protein